MLFDRQRLGNIILFSADVVILFLILLLSLFARTVLPKVIPGISAFHADMNTFLLFFPSGSPPLHTKVHTRENSRSGTK